MPRLELSRVGWALALIVMLISASATMLHMAAGASGSELMGVGLTAIIVGIFALAAGAWIAGKFRLLRIPRHLHTFGELARAVAAMNAAKFAKAHGPARERELWFSLEYIIRDKLAWKGPITPDSRFVEQ